MGFPLFSLLREYSRQRKGVTGVEYSLITAGISLAIMFAVFFFGESILAIFNGMLERLSAFVQQVGLWEGD
ncbi:MAG: Flp family type IVb pilin [Alphaproteobacteria bacterium]